MKQLLLPQLKEMLLSLVVTRLIEKKEEQKPKSNFIKRMKLSTTLSV